MKILARSNSGLHFPKWQNGDEPSCTPYQEELILNRRYCNWKEIWTETFSNIAIDHQIEGDLNWTLSNIAIELEDLNWFFVKHSHWSLNQRKIWTEFFVKHSHWTQKQSYSKFKNSTEKSVISNNGNYLLPDTYNLNWPKQARRRHNVRHWTCYLERNDVDR